MWYAGASCQQIEKAIAKAAQLEEPIELRDGGLERVGGWRLLLLLLLLLLFNYYLTIIFFSILEFDGCGLS